MYMQTARNVYIIVQSVANGQLSISAERTIPIGAIKSIGTSTLKDDWFSIVVGAQQEPDPLLSCVFKTEFFTHLTNALHGQLNLKISDSYVNPCHNHIHTESDMLIYILGLNITRRPGKLPPLKLSKTQQCPVTMFTRAVPYAPARVSRQVQFQNRHLGPKPCLENPSIRASFYDQAVPVAGHPSSLKPPQLDRNHALLLQRNLYQAAPSKLQCWNPDLRLLLARLQVPLLYIIATYHQLRSQNLHHLHLHPRLPQHLSRTPPKSCMTFPATALTN